MIIAINCVRTRIFPSTINGYNISNVYFHCNERCVKIAQPVFLPFPARISFIRLKPIHC